MNLFVNTEADATASLTVAKNNNNQASLNPVFLGDVVDLAVVFTDGQGGLAEFVGHPDVKILLAIGTISDRLAMTTAGTLTLEGEAYTATLNLDTDLLHVFVGSEESQQLSLELQASYANDTTETLCQQPITIRNQLIGAADTKVEFVLLTESGAFLQTESGQYLEFEHVG